MPSREGSGDPLSPRAARGEMPQAEGGASLPPIPVPPLHATPKAPPCHSVTSPPALRGERGSTLRGQDPVRNSPLPPRGAGEEAADPLSPRVARGEMPQAEGGLRPIPVPPQHATPKAPLCHSVTSPPALRGESGSTLRGEDPDPNSPLPPRRGGRGDHPNPPAAPKIACPASGTKTRSALGSTSTTRASWGPTSPSSCDSSVGPPSMMRRRKRW